MKYDVLTTKGKAAEKVELQDEVWNTPSNPDLVAQALYIYHANSRKGTANAKTRAEVRGGGIKPWKQKGTGRARQGSIRSPLWVKGGVAFPPRSHKAILKMSKQMKHKAICCALSDRIRSKSVMIVPSFGDIADGKTKEMESFTNKLGIAGKTIVFVARTEDNQEKMTRASRNMKNVYISAPVELNVYDASMAEYIVLVPEAVNVLEERLLQKKS